MLRDGWSGNMRSAVKLCSSSSISGPSATEKPMVRKSFSACCCARAMGCKPPGPWRRPGSETSMDSPASFESRSLARIASRRALTSASICTFAALMDAPALGRSSAESLPNPLSNSVTTPDLPRKRAFTCSRSAMLDVAAMASRAAAMICSSSFIQKEKGLFRAPCLLYVASGTEARFGLLDEFAECRLVEHREVGEDLAVHVDAGLLEARHELAVRDTRLAGARVDAGDPERAELALLVAAIAVGVLPRAHHRFLGDAVYVLAAAAVTLGLVHVLLVSPARRDSAVFAWHVRGSLSVGEHLLYVDQG